MVEWLFLAVPRGCLRFVIVVFSGHTHLLFGRVPFFEIIDTRISFYSCNTHILPPKPKSSFRHLKRGILDFHINSVLVPVDRAANNVVVA